MDPSAISHPSLAKLFSSVEGIDSSLFDDILGNLVNGEELAQVLQGQSADGSNKNAKHQLNVLQAMNPLPSTANQLDLALAIQNSLAQSLPLTAFTDPSRMAGRLPSLGLNTLSSSIFSLPPGAPGNPNNFANLNIAPKPQLSQPMTDALEALKANSNNAAKNAVLGNVLLNANLTNALNANAANANNASNSAAALGNKRPRPSSPSHTNSGDEDFQDGAHDEVSLNKIAMGPSSKASPAVAGSNPSLVQRTPNKKMPREGSAEGNQPPLAGAGGSLMKDDDNMPSDGLDDDDDNNDGFDHDDSPEPNQGGKKRIARNVAAKGAVDATAKLQIRAVNKRNLNREAQRRFRNRQKAALTLLESTNQAQAQEIATLRLANKVAEDQYRVLLDQYKTLQLKFVQIQMRMGVSSN